MRGTLTGIMGFIFIAVSLVLSVLLMADGTPWTESVHRTAALGSMGVAFMAWGEAIEAKALARRGKDRLP